MIGELVDVFDADEIPTGEIIQREDAIKENKLIKAFQIWIINSKNEVLMQMRSKNKLHDAGMLDLCSGHVKSNETDIHAVIRELNEELGNNIFTTSEYKNITKVGTEQIDFTKYGRKGNYIVPWYLLKLDRTIKDEQFYLQKEEVEKVRWIPYENVKKIIKSKSSNIRIPYISETTKLLEKLDRELKNKSMECER